MDAVASINQRIMQIQSQIAQLSPPVLRTSVAPAGATLTATAPQASFETALAQAIAPTTAAAAPAGTATAADAVPVGGGKALLNAKGVPTELLGYGNGTVPDGALGSIAGTSHRLWAPAARSFDALRQAAKQDGVTIGVTDSYRTYASQVDLAERKGLYSQGGLAAAPGTSMHGWGMALDLGLDSKALGWMRAHAGDYGFVEDTPREPWHWGYRPTR